MKAKDFFAESFAREHATTPRVLHSLPASKSEFKPYSDAPPARVLAAIFSQGQWGIAQAMNGEWEWPPTGKPGATDSYEEVLVQFEETAVAATQAIANASDGRLDEMIPFIRGPQRVGQLPVSELRSTSPAPTPSSAPHRMCRPWLPSIVRVGVTINTAASAQRATIAPPRRSATASPGDHAA